MPHPYTASILLTLHILFHIFFFNDTATTEIYTLSLHDALPIAQCNGAPSSTSHPAGGSSFGEQWSTLKRSEEHTSELQSLTNLVCRLLLEKKKKAKTPIEIASTATITMQFSLSYRTN